MGGQKSIRSYWRNYFEQTDGLVWVVDSTDTSRLNDCKQELHSLLMEEVRFSNLKKYFPHIPCLQRLAGASLLVFANKQDVQGAVSLDTISQVSSQIKIIFKIFFEKKNKLILSIKALDLDCIKTHHWTVLPCSAITGLNLLPGVDWIVEDISSRIYLSS